MRRILIAGVAAAGFGVAATSGSMAAPVNGVVLGDLATGSAPVTQVYWHHGYGHYGWHHGYGYRHYRWDSYGY